MFLRNITTLLLSFKLFLISFNYNLFFENHDPGHGLCDINCNNKNHHFVYYKFEKWKDKDGQVYFRKNIALLPVSFSNSVYFVQQIINDYILSYKLYSRPPPQIK